MLLRLERGIMWNVVETNTNTYSKNNGIKLKEDWR